MGRPRCPREYPHTHTRTLFPRTPTVGCNPHRLTPSRVRPPTQESPPTQVHPRRLSPHRYPPPQAGNPPLLRYNPMITLPRTPTRAAPPPGSHLHPTPGRYTGPRVYRPRTFHSCRLHHRPPWGETSPHQLWSGRAAGRRWLPRHTTAHPMPAGMAEARQGPLKPHHAPPLSYLLGLKLSQDKAQLSSGLPLLLHRA